MGCLHLLAKAMCFDARFLFIVTNCTVWTAKHVHQSYLEHVRGHGSLLGRVWCSWLSGPLVRPDPPDNPFLWEPRGVKDDSVTPPSGHALASGLPARMPNRALRKARTIIFLPLYVLWLKRPTLEPDSECA